MEIIRKDAQIVDTTVDDAFPGTFDVILSAPTEDRDGETLLPDEWKLPLPDHITFDTDHGMSVDSTVGSGVPSIDEATGNLTVSGSYSSLPDAQKVRTLVNEKHIRTVSVAFMRIPANSKAGKAGAKRELLNGAFVAVPSNREALVLASKGAGGSRKDAATAGTVQSVHDATLALGADCTFGKAARIPADAKTVAGSLEAIQERGRDALRLAYPGQWAWLRATLPDSLVFEVDEFYPVEAAPAGVLDAGTYQQSYSDDGTTFALEGGAVAVDLMEVIKTAAPGTAKSPAVDTPAAPAHAAPAPVVDEAPDDGELAIRSARIAAMARLAE